MTDFQDQRHHLLEIIKQHGVTAEEVLVALSKIDRREFVSQTFANRAYEDIPLPIMAGQTISQPTIVGLMTQALKIDEINRILEVGTGSGFQTMVLSYLCRHVYSVERFQALATRAKQLVIDTHKRQNVSIVHADGSLGLPNAAPFDRILVTAASEDVPPTLLEQLKIGGIMVLPLGRENRDQFLMRVTKTTDKDYLYEDLGKVRFVPLLEGVRDD